MDAPAPAPAPAPAAGSRIRTKRKSLDRQTKLAHLQLVSKYYGYSNYSLPRAEGTQQHNPYRRAGHSYSESNECVAESMDCTPLAFPNLRSVSRPQSRSSLASNGSTPSLIDDQSDSEVSHDDDYQYHASTSQLWDSFWVAGDQPRDFEDQHHDQDQPPKTPQKSRGEPKARYPALIPSPHIRRNKKTSTINYEDDPLPPKPIEYTTIVIQPSPPSQQPPSPPKCRIVTSAAEKRRTIRAVKSSYSLFPKQHQTTTTTTTISARSSTSSTITVTLPPPRTSSLPGAESPTPKPRKSSRPPPIHTHSAPLRQNSGFTLAIPSPALRSSSSAAMLPRTSTSSTRTTGGTLVSDPTTVKSTLPNFPSANLADLVHPRSAPLPPIRRAPTPPSAASYFDFDSSDSESDSAGPPIARLVKSRRAATFKPASPRRSADSARPRRKSLVAWRSADDHDEPRARDVFGRMFGRSSRAGSS
ncbi:hypothetical protein ACHAQA_009001 [Verticillium albo-atrum]